MNGETPTSFSKSLFFGHVPETMVIPYPRLRPEERDNLKLILESFHKFAEAEIDPKKIDDESRLSPQLLKGLKELGLFGLAIGESHGGVGLSTTGYARVMEDVAGIDASVAVTLGAHQSIGCKGVVLFGTEEQKARYLPRLATGELVA